MPHRRARLVVVVRARAHHARCEGGAHFVRLVAVLRLVKVLAHHVVQRLAPARVQKSKSTNLEMLLVSTSVIFRHLTQNLERALPDRQTEITRRIYVECRNT